MEWMSELDGSEFQSIFYSHVYATIRVTAGDEIRVNYGKTYCRWRVRCYRA